MPVDPPVDNLFAAAHSLYESSAPAPRTKNNQANSRFFMGFSPAHGADLPPKSVGASVDKMFAVACSPYKQRLAEL
jgi:hypothetical protein